MRTRLLIAAAAVLTAAPPLLARAPAPAGGRAAGPPVVVYTQPVGKLLESVKAIARTVAGDGPAGAIDQGIRGKLGEAGLAGLDLGRPLAAYMSLPDKPLVEPEDLKTLSGVVVIPVESEKGFRDLLARAFGDDAPELKPVAGDDGLFAVEGKNGPAPIPVHLRFADKSAYVGINVPADGMAAAKLVRPESFVEAKDDALFAVRFFADRYPEELRKNPTKGLDEQMDKLRELTANLGPQAEAMLNAYAVLVKGYAKRWADAEEGGVRVRFDERSGEVMLETTTRPRKGTPLAREIAARPASTNQFGGLVRKDAAAAVTLSIPFATEVRPLLLQGLAFARKGLEQVPEEARPLVEELINGAERTVKGDSLDVVATVWRGAGGKWTAVAALTFDGADKLAEPIKKAVKVSDKKTQEMFKFDVATADGVSLHEFAPPADEPGEPEWFKKLTAVTGGRATTLAFGPKAAYAAYGGGGRDAIKAALAVKPAAAKPFEVMVNPKRLAAMVSAVDANAGGMVGQLLGDDDRAVSAVYLTSEGGDALTYRLGVNLKVVVRPFVMARGGGR